ncbi:YlbE-like family protein [Bacillus tianshenii]|nr:YlbE-like family protein [Bacillus tianshenii]
MRLETQYLLNNRPDLKTFVRENPYWYRLLSRDPNAVTEIEQHAKYFYGKTLPQQMQKMRQQLQMVSMMMAMMQAMKE